MLQFSWRTDKMQEEIAKKILQDRRVIEEINRHLWIESEKVGFDKGFEWAAEDWLKRFSKAWIDYHMPQKKLSSRKLLEVFKKNKK